MRETFSGCICYRCYHCDNTHIYTIKPQATNLITTPSYKQLKGRSVSLLIFFSIYLFVGLQCASAHMWRLEHSLRGLVLSSWHACSRDQTEGTGRSMHLYPPAISPISGTYFGSSSPVDHHCPPIPLGRTSQ